MNKINIAVVLLSRCVHVFVFVFVFVLVFLFVFSFSFVFVFAVVPLSGCVHARADRHEARVERIKNLGWYYSDTSYHFHLSLLFIIIIMIITKLKEKNQESWSVPISLPFKLPQYFSVRTKRDCLFVGLVPKPARQV